MKSLEGVLRSRRNLALAGVFAVGLTLRLLAGADYPYHPDAAYMALKAEQVYSLGRMFEPRAIPTYPPVWPYVLAGVAKMLDGLAGPFYGGASTIHSVEVYLPPVIGALLGLATAVLGRVLYDWRTGLLAGLGVSLSPLAIALSARGATDHDALSSTLIALTFAAFLVCFRGPSHGDTKSVLKTALLWAVPGLLYTVSLLTWKGSIVLTAFVGVAIAGSLLFGDPKRKGHWYYYAAYTASFFLIPTAVGYLFNFEGYNVVLSAVDMFASVGHYVLAFLGLGNVTARGTVSLLFPSVAEYQPLTPTLVFYFLGLAVILAPLSLIAFYLKPTEKSMAGTLLFGLTFMAAFRSSDFAYMAVPYVSLAAARFTFWGLDVAKSERAERRRIDPVGRERPSPIFPLSVTALVLAPIPLGGVAGVLYASSPGSLPIMPQYWFGPFNWMKANTPNDSLIFTWWDYGYWTSYWGHRLPVVDNGYQPDQRIVDVARSIIGSNVTAAEVSMARYAHEDGMHHVYYMITSAELPIMSAIQYAANFNLSSDKGAGFTPVTPEVLHASIFYRLYDSNATVGQEPIPGFLLVYENEQVQIYDVATNSTG